jgi:hypothetical protein
MHDEPLCIRGAKISNKDKIAAPLMQILGIPSSFFFEATHLITKPCSDVLQHFVMWSLHTVEFGDCKLA